GCHAYTHVDAPLHFRVDGRDIAAMPVDQWVGDAAVVDLTHLGANGEVTAADLDRRAGHVRAGAIVLLRDEWPARETGVCWRARTTTRPHTPAPPPARSRAAGRRATSTRRTRSSFRPASR